MKHFSRNMALGLAGGSFATSRLLAFRVRKPVQTGLILPKMMVQPAAPYLGAIGVAGSLLGLLSRSRGAAMASTVLGAAGALTSVNYIRQILARRSDFEAVFGPDWEMKIPVETKRHMLQQRWAWRIPPSPQARWQRNVPFWSIPGRDKPLLCDIWQPPAGMPPSGLAFIYLHGSAWHYLDKDFGTRTMFRHLAAQGHVVMDVAYRLCPEVEIHTMVGDAKRAIVWMKRNASRYGVNPDKVVVAGGSAGGHLALMSAYTTGLPDFTPQELDDADTSVRGVVSWYGPIDMVSMYEYGLRTTGSGEPDPTRPKNLLANVLDKLILRFVGRPDLPPYTLAQIYTNLLGAIPPQDPAAARKGSPLNYVREGCPPTLLFQGEADSLVPVEPARELYAKLREARVPALYLEFPQTEHAFDLVLASISMPGQVALYDTDRFLALLAAPEFAENNPVEQIAEVGRQ